MARAARPVSSSRRTAAGQSHARVTIINNGPLPRYHEVRSFEGGTRTPTITERLGLSPSPTKAAVKRRSIREEREAAIEAEIQRILAERK